MYVYFKCNRQLAFGLEMFQRFNKKSLSLCKCAFYSLLLLEWMAFSSVIIKLWKMHALKF